MLEGEFRLTPRERAELKNRMRSGTLPAEDVRRARLILLLAQGKSYLTIRQQLGCNPNYISSWKGRFEAERLAGLYSRHSGRALEKRTPALEAKILEWTRRPAADGSTHWSSRKLARHLGVSHMMVARVWQRAGLKPHRIELYMASDDPDFELKAADIIGLYVKPPQHAAVFCVDEKTAIQALDRLDPVLPLSPGRLERHGFEYYRHGTLSLYAALNTRNGAVLWAKPPRGTPARSLPPSSPNWSPISRAARRFISLPTISRPQDQTGGAIPRGSPQSPSPLHPDLLLLAQSGRKLVRQDRARCHRPRCLHLGQGLGPQAHTLHPSLQSRSQAHQVDLPRPLTAHQP